MKTPFARATPTQILWRVANPAAAMCARWGRSLALDSRGPAGGHRPPGRMCRAKLRLSAGCDLCRAAAVWPAQGGCLGKKCGQVGRADVDEV